MQITTTVTLSPREEAFVIALARGRKPTRAAVDAGYSIAAGRLQMRKPAVAAAIRSIGANLDYVRRKMDAMGV